MVKTTMQEISIGTRRIQRVAGAHTINVPAMIVRAFDLHSGDAMRWTITSDGKLRIEKEHTPAAGGVLGGATPAAGEHQTRAGVDASVI
jgi:hypothetical protein